MKYARPADNSHNFTIVNYLPAVLTLEGFTLGRDIDFDFTGNQGQTLNFNDITVENNNLIAISASGNVNVNINNITVKNSGQIFSL